MFAAVGAIPLLGHEVVVQPCPIRAPIRRLLDVDREIAQRRPGRGAAAGRPAVEGVDRNIGIERPEHRHPFAADVEGLVELEQDDARHVRLRGTVAEDPARRIFSGSMVTQK